MCDAGSMMVRASSASRAAQTPLLAPDDAPAAESLMVERRMLEATLAEGHQGVFISHLL